LECIPHGAGCCISKIMLQKFKQIKWERLFIIVQMLVLFISIPTNVVLYMRNNDLEKRIKFADYNDRAWSLLRSFELQYRELEEDVRLKLDSLFVSKEDTIDFLTTIQKLNELWETHFIRLIREAASRIRGYEEVITTRLGLEAIDMLDQLIQSSKPPSAMARQLVYQKASEIKRLIRNLPPSPPMHVFPPSGSEILIYPSGETELVVPKKLETVLTKRSNWLDALMAGLDQLSDKSMDAVRKTWSIQEKSLQK